MKYIPIMISVFLAAWRGKPPTDAWDASTERWENKWRRDLRKANEMLIPFFMAMLALFAYMVFNFPSS